MPTLEVFHLSAECHPIAKVGELADVVSALAVRQNELNVDAKVVMPYFDNTFVKQEKFNAVFEGQIEMGKNTYKFKVLSPKETFVWFDLFLIRIEGLLDREDVYDYSDDTERYIAFQIATLDFLNQLQRKPDIIHCHDHPSGLIPFMMLHCHTYSDLRSIPTIFTLYNAHFQGDFSFEKLRCLPLFNHLHIGLLEWNEQINPMASAIKCAWRVVTVSPTYLDELRIHATGLQKLMAHEKEKSIGILNGIDYSIWNPNSDSRLVKKYSFESVTNGKKINKEFLCNRYGLDPEKPLFVFIGELIWQKGADLLPEIISKMLSIAEKKINFFVLGSDNKEIGQELLKLEKEHRFDISVHLEYDETLEHLTYAAADFLLMPSRVEPSGNNQKKALRYGAIPIVNNVGGLNDTVIDCKKKNGNGIKVEGVSVIKIRNAILRAQQLYGDKRYIGQLRKIGMQNDNSWKLSVEKYLKLYRSVAELK